MSIVNTGKTVKTYLNKNEVYLVLVYVVFFKKYTQNFSIESTQQVGDIFFLIP